VTSSSSVRVGAAVPPKSGCLRYWKACGRVSQLSCMSLKKNLAALIDQFLTVAIRICGPRVARLTLSTERTGAPWDGDIIRTVGVAPTLENVFILALIVVIRTFLSMALHLEVEGRWPWQRRWICRCPLLISFA